MPRNNELIAEANELAQGLDISVETNDLSNKKLVALVADLKAKKRDAELSTGADDAEIVDTNQQSESLTDIEDNEEDNVDVKEDQLPEKSATDIDKSQDELNDIETPAKTGYEIAKGKALTTRRGIKADGDKIEPSDLVGGQKTIDGFLKSGHIVKA